MAQTTSALHESMGYEVNGDRWVDRNIPESYVNQVEVPADTGLKESL